MSKASRNSQESLSKKKSKDELQMAKKSKGKHPKADHANPSGNLVENQRPWIPGERDTIKEHLWVTDYANFDPQLYAFKTPEKLSTKKPVMAECPPFWVLCDHTVAVAWKLYCEEAVRSDLGIVALQWSREFVSAMKDERGAYPNAIKHLLDAIEDGLIFRYSTAAENSKKAHEKDDGVAYASSESVFKQPIEVSYTLKDILSRNFPGRKFGDDHDKSIVRKDDKNATAVGKSTLLPFAVLGDGEGMQQKDLVDLLKQCKVEQDARINHEINAQKQIVRLLKQAQEGKLPIQVQKKDHVDFAVPEHTEETLRSSKPNRTSRGFLGQEEDDLTSLPDIMNGNDVEVKQTTSTTSNKSARSDTSGKSAISSKSGRSSVSSEFRPDSPESASASELSRLSSASIDSNSSKGPKSKRRKRSSEKLSKRPSGSSAGGEDRSKRRKTSKDKVKKRKSKDSIASNKSKGSASSRKKGSKKGSKISNL